MQCYNPRLAFRRFDHTKIKFTGLSWSTYIIQTNGKNQLKQKFNTLFSHAKNIDLSNPLKIPCGKCDPCRLQRSGETARRAHDEFKINNSVGMFITLTYDDKNLPSCKHYNQKDIVDFVKRLRKISPKVRTLGVAEYGERTRRAHFHLLVFGHEFKDKKLLRNTDSTHTGQSYDIFTSKTLTQLWDKGITEFGSVTEQSCSYVARYLFKKNKKETEGTYCEICQNEKPQKSKIVARSRRPGLGAAYCDRYITGERLRSIRDGNKNNSVPRYYSDRIRKTLTESDQLALTSRPDYVKIRDNERKEKINAEKIINQQKLGKLYKTKI